MYLATINSELEQPNSILLQELQVRLRVRLRAQAPTKKTPFAHSIKTLHSSFIAQIDLKIEKNKARKNGAQDGAQAERLQKAEVGSVREAGAVEAAIDHREVDRRHEKLLLRRLSTLSRRHMVTATGGEFEDQGVAAGLRHHGHRRLILRRGRHLSLFSHVIIGQIGWRNILWVSSASLSLA